MAKKYRSFQSAFADAPKIAMSKIAKRAELVAMEFEKDASQVMPRDTGIMAKSQSHSISVSPTNIRIKFITDTPYARKVYFVTALNGSIKWYENIALRYSSKYIRLFTK